MIITIVFITILAFILLISFIFLLMNYKMSRGRVRAEYELASMGLDKITEFGSVDSLSVIPVVDYYPWTKDILQRRVYLM